MSWTQESESKKTDIGYEGRGENWTFQENLGWLSILKVSLNEVQPQTAKMGISRMILDFHPHTNSVKNWSPGIIGEVHGL